jgi:cell shape-determining protein MreD
LPKLDKQTSPEYARALGVAVVVLMGILYASFIAAPRMRLLVWGIPPDLTILIVVWLGLRAELWLGASGAFVLGIAEDGLSLVPTGFYP